MDKFEKVSADVPAGSVDTSTELTLGDFDQFDDALAMMEFEISHKRQQSKSESLRTQENEERGEEAMELAELDRELNQLS